LIARPEGTEIKRIGETEETPAAGKQQDASAKPMLLREACDLCEEMDLGPMCIKFCPFDAISDD
jgi:ferredoxin